MLLTLNLDHLDDAFNEWWVDQPPYTEVSIGRDSGGDFRTTRLKEYPPSFCASISAAFVRTFQQRSTLADAWLPHGFLQRCKEMQCTFSAYIGRDFAGT
eukprot:Skav227250  [mRNA]  locus=scaffold6496:14653:14949:- [translate_table: standard]